jgi:hypothetical protein
MEQLFSDAKMIVSASEKCGLSHSDCCLDEENYNLEDGKHALKD